MCRSLRDSSFGGSQGHSMCVPIQDPPLNTGHTRARSFLSSSDLPKSSARIVSKAIAISPAQRPLLFVIALLFEVTTDIFCILPWMELMSTASEPDLDDSSAAKFRNLSPLGAPSPSIYRAPARPCACIVTSADRYLRRVHRRFAIWTCTHPPLIACIARGHSSSSFR